MPLASIGKAWIQLGAEVQVEIGNLSTSGMGLRRIGFGSVSPLPGTEITGELGWGGARRYRFRARVVYVSRDAVGVSFSELAPEFHVDFLKRFTVELAAARMHRIDSSTLRKQSDGLPSFHFGDGNELYLVESGEGEQAQVVRFYATVLGNYFEGAVGKPLFFGRANDDEGVDDDGDVSYKGSSVIEGSAKVPPEMLEILRRFIGAVDGLPPRHRDAVLAMLGR